MIAEIATLCLIFACLICSLSIVGDNILPTSIKLKTNPAKLAILSCCLVGSAFFMLILLFAISDFSVATIFNNSHSNKPILYKIIGSWSNHEGSILLWLFLLSLGGAMLAGYGKLEKELRNISLRIHNFILMIFGIYVVFLSNPFQRIFPSPKEGMGLNPVLQDIALSIHPPMLYIGYTSTAVIFSLAMSLIIKPPKNPEKISLLINIWSLISWSSLTIGIGLGSHWAYRELGWGGWWFWDPVENLSLITWLILTALIHTCRIAMKGKIMYGWLVILATTSFATSLMSSFVVRSGLLTSIHSFASDPNRGIYLLTASLLLISGGIITILMNKPRYKSRNINLISKEFAMLGNNAILIAAAVGIIIAIFFPLITELIAGEIISIGAMYYNSAILPLLIPLLLLMIVGITAKPRIDNIKNIAKANIAPLILALLLTLSLFIFDFDKIINQPKIAIYEFLSLWIIASSVIIIAKNIRKNFPMDKIAMSLAHVGIGIMILAASLSAIHSTEIEREIKQGDEFQLGKYDFKYKKQGKNIGENFQEMFILLEITHDKKYVTSLQPSIRKYQTKNNKITAETAIYSTPLFDIYSVISNIFSHNDKISVRIKINYGMNLIWLGFLVATLGGIIGIVTKYRQKI